MITLSHAANDDIVVKGEKPQWHAGSPAEDLTKFCTSETDQKKKLSACNQAMINYASMPLKLIPKEAKSQAQYLLQLHQADPKDATFIFGLHNSHIVIGRLALRDGDLKTAKDELVKSLQVPLTPPLQTIGPRMSLAADLLEKKQKQAVLDYLTEVEKVWTQNPSAKQSISKWRLDIKAGKTPQFKTER